MKLKKFASLLLALVMMLALATPAYAANVNQGGILKLDKQDTPTDQYNRDVWSTWSDVIFLGDAATKGYDNTDEDVSAWHLLVRGSAVDTNVTSMELTFTNGSQYTWSKENGDKLSSPNGGSKTNGWIIVAPVSWGKITYGKVTPTAGEFNISGYFQGGSGDDTGNTSTALSFYKYVDGNLAEGETFGFDFYQNVNGEESKIEAPTPTIEDGVYTYNFEPALEDGNYIIKEVLAGDQANRYVDGKTLEFTVENGEPIFAADDNSITNETKTVVEFAKTVDGAVPTEDFQFDLYQGDTKIKANAFTASEDHDTYTATFSPKLADGKYTIKEVLTDGQVGQYVDGKTLSFTVENGVVVAGDTALAIDNEQKGFIDVTTPTVIQKYIKQVHENEYRLYEEGTLVSHVASVSGAELPDGITGNYLKNGMTYLTIDKAKLAAAGENGVTIGIAQSDPQKGNKKSWNTPAPAPLGENDQPSYNLKIEGGKLVVTSELPNIGVRLYSAKESPKGPSDFKGSFATKGHLTGVTTATFDIPKGDTFKFFLHVEDTSYYTNEIIGCKLVSSEVLEQAYNCELTTVVTDTDGNVMSDYTNGLLPGTYTVTVTATVNGVVKGTWSEPVEVQPGETTFVDFGTQYVEEMGEPVIDCPQNCGTIKLIPLTPAEPVEP